MEGKTPGHGQPEAASEGPSLKASWTRDPSSVLKTSELDPHVGCRARGQHGEVAIALQGVESQGWGGVGGRISFCWLRNGS